MSERKLATIRKISELLPIEGADRIEIAVIDGWKVVVKKGEFVVGQLCVYFEVDSWVPTTVAPFLTRAGSEPKEYLGVKGERLRTVKLRKQLSQGLVLPLSVLNVEENGIIYESLTEEGDDVTEVLGVLKYEKPVPAQLAGQVRGNFPSAIPKTDQNRIQNLRNEFYNEFRSHDWEVTEKLHGSSCTFFLDFDGEFHVCSRNLNLKRDENNAYWKAAIKYGVEEEMRNLGLLGYAIQGELVGEGINSNQYNVKGLDFYVFDIYSCKTQSYLRGAIRGFIVDELGLLHVPVLETYAKITENNLDLFIAYADGQSKLNNSKREGLVWKSEDDPSVSFKVVSNQWLLNGGEDQ